MSTNQVPPPSEKPMSKMSHLPSGVQAGLSAAMQLPLASVAACIAASVVTGRHGVSVLREPPSAGTIATLRYPNVKTDCCGAPSSILSDSLPLKNATHCSSGEMLDALASG